MTDRADELLLIASQIGQGIVPPVQHSECYTSGAFDLLLVNAYGPKAFQLLTTLCERYPAVAPQQGSLAGYFQLLTQLARQSQTSELPPGLADLIARHPDLSAELREWYRLGA